MNLSMDLAVLADPVVVATAEALAHAAWIVYGERADDWAWLPEGDRAELVIAQLPAARVAVNAIQEAA